MDAALLAHLRDGTKVMADLAAGVNTTALSVFGGTILGILGSKFLRPTGKVRRSYLLFFPAWVCLAASIYHGDAVARGYAAAAIVNDDHILAAAQGMNSSFALQREYLFAALLFFAVWLGILLWWWIFTKETLTPAKD